MSETRGDALPLLFYADGYKFPDVYHVTRFLAPDPIIALEQNGEVVIVANPLEEGRARKESRAREVFNIDTFGAKEIAKTAETREELDAEIIKRFLASRGAGRVAVGTVLSARHGGAPARCGHRDRRRPRAERAPPREAPRRDRRARGHAARDRGCVDATASMRCGARRRARTERSSSTASRSPPSGSARSSSHDCSSWVASRRARSSRRGSRPRIRT